MNSIDIQEINRLKWRCRRGMREMDLLLMHFLDQYYYQLTVAQREAFAELLDLQDPLLYQLLMQVVPAPNVVSAEVIALINPQCELSSLNTDGVSE